MVKQITDVGQYEDYSNDVVMIAGQFNEKSGEGFTEDCM